MPLKIWINEIDVLELATLRYLLFNEKLIKIKRL